MTMGTSVGTNGLQTKATIGEYFSKPLQLNPLQNISSIRVFSSTE
jgi:hypothetical protein